jgi:tetratricopeptide (TPR) repeat protein
MPHAACRIAVVCGLLVTGCAGTQQMTRRSSSRGAYGAYLRGLMLERSSQFPDALDAYQKALERDHWSPLLHVRVGATYVKLGQMAKALGAFEQALALDPNHPDALRWVAMLHASQGRLEDAVAAYERLLRVEPTDEFVLSTLADLYVLQGQLTEAVALYHTLIELSGSSSQLHFNLGVLHGRLRQFEESVAELSRAIELSPDSLDVRVVLGLTYELNGRLEDAVAHYEEAIRVDPLNPRLYHHAARAHLNAQHWAQALANYHAALDLVPRDVEAMLGLVRVWVAQGRFDEAERFLARQLKELGDAPELYVALGVVYREAKQAEEAVRAFERAIALKAEYPQAYFYLAAQLDQLGHQEEARANLRRTLELDPKHPDAMNYLGYLDAESGQNLSEAKALIERALELDPENGAYVDSLGWVCFKMGRLDEAVAHLERAAGLLDTDPVIFDHLGEAYVARRDVERARASWRRALELNPSQADAIAIQEKLGRLDVHEPKQNAHDADQRIPAAP